MRDISDREEERVRAELKKTLDEILARGTLMNQAVSTSFNSLLKYTWTSCLLSTTSMRDATCLGSIDSGKNLTSSTRRASVLLGPATRWSCHHSGFGPDYSSPEDPHRSGVKGLQS